MDDFKIQIDNDIQIIQKEYERIDSKLEKPEYAFHYWVLSRLYNVDEEISYSFITEGNDKNIDCFVHFEDTKELYIIQSKYYDINTPVVRDNVSDFLSTPLNVLCNGKYRRSEELQKIFNRVCGDPEYKIWLHFYITNNKINDDANDLIHEFTNKHKKISAFVGARIFYLDDIQNIYYGERFNNVKNFSAILPTKVKGTSLDVRPEDYDISWMINVRYVMVNVGEIFRIYRKASEKGYEIFDENIREYLGRGGSINKKIIDTLKSSEDRENFFYYNNGITITCKQCDTLRSNELPGKYTYGFRLKNPQIVNGCQTINSIAEVLSHYSDKDIDKEFERCYVLTKVFVFDKETSEKKPHLEKNIIKYTNSQNSITDKAFASKRLLFANIQTELKKRGFLLLVKPSDKNKFIEEFKDEVKLKKLKIKSKEKLSFYNLDFTKTQDYMIPLEKLVQVLLAFYNGGYDAFTKKNRVLKPNSELYKSFSLNIEKNFTIDNMLNLFLLYKKAEIEQKQSGDRIPIPYYLLGFLGNGIDKIDFQTLNSKLSQVFCDKERFTQLYLFSKNLTKMYAEEYYREKQMDYNRMIKQEIDMAILERCINISADNLISFGAIDDKTKDFFTHI